MHCALVICESLNLKGVMMEKLYDLPHKFGVFKDEDGYCLMCNGKFVYWNECLDQVFIVLGKHLKTVKG